MAKRAVRAAPKDSVAARKRAAEPQSTSVRPDALVAYKNKRNFAKTAEPEGRVRGAVGDRFCVQKHDATRLHYDLRLELDGVLRALPRSSDF